MPTPPMRRRAVVLCTTVVLATGAAGLTAPAALADGTNCYDGSAQPLGTTVTCDAANDVVLTVPAGTTSLTLDVVGAGGGSTPGADGGDPYELEGHATLPSGTAYLRVVTGPGGVAGVGGTGAGASSVAALDSTQQLIGRVLIAGGGGSAGFTTDSGGQVSAGEDANSPGSAPSVAAVTGGGSAVGDTGGAGGTGPNGGTENGAAGQDADDTSPVPAAGGGPGFVNSGPISAVGGSGGGGYAGGGGGAAGDDGSGYSATGGGGGDSFASTDVYDLSASVAAGGGRSGTDGAPGIVYVTFNGTPVPSSNVPTVPVAPEYHPGRTSMRVLFHKPLDDGGSPILGYRISLDGGATWSAPLAYTGPATGPYWATVTGLRPGTTYQVRMQAWNANGYGGAIRPPARVTTKALAVPSVPVGIEAAPTGTPGRVRLFWHKPLDEGGTPILGYRVSLNGGGTWSGPLRVYGPATGPYAAFVSGLVPGRTYQVRMQAWNAVGYGGAPRTPVAVTPR